MKLNPAELPSCGSHRQVAATFSLVEPADRLPENRPPYTLLQRTLAEAVVEEAPVLLMLHFTLC